MRAGGRSRLIGAASAVVALVALAGVVSAGVGRLQEAPFPHEAHAGLFPVCTGCHTAPAGGEPGFPPPGQCAQCHDGANLPAVTWSGPTPASSNLRFEHVSHALELQAEGEPVPGCEVCHSGPGDLRMRVEGRVEEASCFACHTPAEGDHYSAEPAAAASCEACHVPLAGSDFPVGRIAQLPVPADHIDGRFLPDLHGVDAAENAARCATCHTVDRCVACHVDTGSAVLALIPAAPPGLELPPATAAYPVPESHRAELWDERHAPVADAASCNTCHTTDDCRACHVAPAQSVVDALPRRADVEAPGVGLTPRAPGTHASPFFHESHATLAAADDGSCVTCHTESYCTDCHDAPSGASYHPPGFVSGHTAVAFGRADDCAACHETAAFCRACHIESGFGSVGRLAAGYHDAEPIWLLRHGQAARQNLESCASCHEQRDCVQCHGVLGAFKVSPHQPGFDAERAWATSPRTCLACHVGNPLGGG